MFYLGLCSNGYFLGLDRQEVANKHWRLSVRALNVIECYSATDALNMLKAYLSTECLPVKRPEKLVIGTPVFWEKNLPMLFIDLEHGVEWRFYPDGNVKVTFTDGISGEYRNFPKKISPSNPILTACLLEFGYLLSYDFDNRQLYRVYADGTVAPDKQYSRTKS